jgi:hypothetical protein
MPRFFSGTEEEEEGEPGWEEGILLFVSFSVQREVVERRM